MIRKYVSLTSSKLKYLFLLILFVSCTKKNEELKAVFTWNFKGANQVCESPYAEIIMGTYHQIHGENLRSNGIHLYPNDFNVGNYIVDSNDTLNNAILVLRESLDSVSFVIPSSGNINILKNDNGRLTGDFDLKFDQGYTVTGKFENVEIL